MHRSASGQTSSYLQLRASKNLSIHTPSSTHSNSSSSNHHSNYHLNHQSVTSHQSSTYSSTRDAIPVVVHTPSVLGKSDSLRSSSSSSAFVKMQQSASATRQSHQGSSTARPISQDVSNQSQQYYNHKANELFHLLNRDILQPNAISLNPQNYSSSSSQSTQPVSHYHSENNNSNNKENMQNQSNRVQYPQQHHHYHHQQPPSQETFRTRQNAKNNVTAPKSPLAMSNRSMTSVSPSPLCSSSLTNTKLKHPHHNHQSPNSTSNSNMKSSKTSLSKKHNTSLYSSDYQDQNTSINISHLLNLNTIFTNPSVYSSQQQQQQIKPMSQRASIEAQACSSSSTSSANNNNSTNSGNSNMNNQAHMLENCVIIQKQNEIAGLRKDLRNAITESTTIKNRLKVSEAECKTLRAQAETERRYRPLVDEYVGKIKGMQFLLAHEKRISAKVIQETLLRNQNMSLILENLANIISIIQQKIDAMTSPAEKILQSIRESLNPILMCLLPVIDDIHQHNQVIQGQQQGNNVYAQNGAAPSAAVNGEQKNNAKSKRNNNNTSTSTAGNWSNSNGISTPGGSKDNQNARNNNNNNKKQQASHQPSLPKQGTRLKQQQSASVRSSLQSSNSSNQIFSRNSHAVSVDEYSSSSSSSLNPADICRPRSYSQLPKNSSHPLRSSVSTNGAGGVISHSNNNLSGIAASSQNQSAADILISDSFYQQCLTNNSLRISESSYQASTMKFPSQQNSNNPTTAVAAAAAAAPSAALLSLFPKNNTSPTHRMSSHGLFEFSHSPESVQHQKALAAMGSFAKPTRSHQGQTSSLIDEDCIANLLEGVDITTVDEANNLRGLNNSQFNESQKIFNNTLKGLSETLKNLREEDQFEPYQLSLRPSPAKVVASQPILLQQSQQLQQSIEKQIAKQQQYADSTTTNAEVVAATTEVTPSSTHKEIEMLKNRILQRQSRRKLNSCENTSTSVSPCSKSAFTTIQQNNQSDFTSENEQYFIQFQNHNQSLSFL